MEIGDIFDSKYQVVDILGKGGMGTVYLAKNIKLDTLWAIKEINKRNNSKIDVLVEPNILKKLNHPALPRIFDIFEDEECIFIIADYIEGISLDRELDRGMVFDEKQVIEWAAQICDVLSYLHNYSPNPIIYRDMKPSNIIHSRNGSIKLIDFGIAREYKTGSKSDTIYIGTIGYAAPEQYGTGQSSPTSDIYSLGVTMYHLLTGKRPSKIPFEAECMRLLDYNFSKGMVEIIKKCTRTNPSERYQSSLELLSELHVLNDTAAIEKNYEKRLGNKTEPMYMSFKKLVLTVCDNPEFACEFACATARLTKFKVLLINLDILSIRTNLYLGLDRAFNNEAEESTPKLKALKKILEEGRMNFDAFENISIKLSDCGNLFVISGASDTEHYIQFELINLDRLINEAYKSFDITILVTGKDISNPLVKIAIERSDYYIIAARANMDTLSEYKNYLDGMFDIPIEKVKFVAWEYREGVNLPESILKQAFGGGCYAGKMSYCENREKSRNFEGEIYTRTAWRRHREEYRKIMVNFDIVPEKTVGEYMKGKIEGLFSRHLGGKQ